MFELFSGLTCDFHLEMNELVFIRRSMDSPTSTHLISVQAIDNCDTDVRSFDPNVFGEGGKHGSLHFNVSYALRIALLQESHLFRLAVITRGSIDTALSFKSNM